MKYPRASAASRGYDNAWRKARAAFLAEHPTCLYCEQAGRLTPATVVDHSGGHGKGVAFWDVSAWIPVCRPCHDGTAKQRDRSGTIRGAGVDGRPLDPGHHWNK